MLYINDVIRGPNVTCIPAFPLAVLSKEVTSFVTGPEEGIGIFDNDDTGKEQFLQPYQQFTSKSWSDGHSVSLYNKNPLTGERSGDPNADSYLICARKNSALLVVADGLNWGENSRLASRSAVYGSFRHVETELFRKHAGKKKTVLDTKTVCQLLVNAFTAAHNQILHSKCHGLTTLCMALVLPIASYSEVSNSKKSNHFLPARLRGSTKRETSQTTSCVCLVSVGDSSALLLRQRHGLVNLTHSRQHHIHASCQHDHRDTGGALGPVLDGDRPQLRNLTCTFSLCNSGDIVLLASDGITDNFDPVVAQIALPISDSMKRRSKSEDALNKLCSSSAASSSDHAISSLLGKDSVTSGGDSMPLSNSKSPKLSLTDAQRDQMTIKEIERTWCELEFSDTIPCARSWCHSLVKKVEAATKERRQLLEQRRLFRGKLSPDERELLYQKVAETLKTLPGKLDHATVAAYQIASNPQPK